MPCRTDISSILIIGAGPIIIGQACEFDYSGAQACKALKEEGFRVILVNSNPATIMTDPELADATYIEPINPEFVARIIEKERPDALLPTMGGQTALNTAIALAQNGTLDKFKVQLIGADLAAIQKAEDRQLFRKAMDKIGLESPRSAIAHSLEEAEAGLETIGLPAIIRPSFTLGGTGGGIAYTAQEFETIVAGGLAASPTTEVLIEESVLGWKEYEMEVVRDKADNCIIICSIENIDPMGVHTGDSITVAPALTLSDREYQIMRNASIAILREIGVETGGSNVQFAVDPKTGRLVVIEMNPRVSRSSALASKATGFPIAKIAAKLAVGYTLDELINDITATTPASFEPSIDYVVTKIPRFAFEKFPGAEPMLSTAMKSVGEVMAIGRNFAESLQKALRGLETGLTGLNPQYDFAPDASPSPNADTPIVMIDDIACREAALTHLTAPTPHRFLYAADALRHNISVARICQLTGFDAWFINQLRDIVDMERKLAENNVPDTAESMRAVKALGFCDARIGELTGHSEAEIRTARHALGVRPHYRRIDTCAAEFAANTPYLYSSYDAPSPFGNQDEAAPETGKKAVILGGGPNRIGQGIEFDYCCCHAAFALQDAGIESIMVNCNPETVSTDYDTASRLYFEPLTEEDVLEVLACEQQKGTLAGVIVQFGGQTPLKLSQALEKADIPILGTAPDAIDLAEDRDRFKALLEQLDLRQPPNGIARSTEQAHEIAKKIGFPVVIRPSYVLGGRAMEIVADADQLERYMHEAVIVSGTSPVLIDGYLRDAIELDVDILSDGQAVYVAGILEHIEEAGVHSGDSACSMPPHSLSPELIAEIERQAEKMALALNVVGLMNVQFAVQNGTIYVIEVNPRASRTVPFVAKVLGQPIARIAARLMVGAKLAEFGLKKPDYDHIAVKESVFPFARFQGVDTILGPEMRSTGEVMGLDSSFPTAFAKSQIGSGMVLPEGGAVFISVRDSDKSRAIAPARQLIELGFALIATHGTADFLKKQGLAVSPINKVREGHPHIVDAMQNNEIQMLVNTTQGQQSVADSKSIRRTALLMKMPYFTTMAAAQAAVSAIAALDKEQLTVTSLQEYNKRRG